MKLSEKQSGLGYMPSGIKVNNYYGGFIQEKSPENYFDLLKGNKFKLEKIVSKGYSTPENKWLSGNKNEFVILLKGKAELLFESGIKLKLNEGDYFTIPANTKHKVTKTSKKPVCYWLTIHFS